MGTVMHLPYTNNEIFEAECFVKNGRALNDPAPVPAVQEDEFGRRIDDAPHFIQELFEKAARDAPARRDIKRDGRHDSTARIVSVDTDLESVDQAWAELLGYAEKPEVDDDSKTKKVTESSRWMVDGVPLAKSELTSRMFHVVEQIRSFCVGAEAEQLEKAVRALDITAFAELAEPVLARMKHAAELIRSC